MSRYKEYLNDANRLHFNIVKGDNEEVKKFLIKHSQVKFALSEGRESAAAKALRSGRIEIYKTLISKGLCLAPHEDIAELVKPLSDITRKTLREIHKNNIKEPSLKHLSALIAKSKLSHDSSEHKRGFFLELIVKAFEELNEIELVEPILKVVANSNDLNIIFDFKRDSVELMDPTNDKNTKGICYHRRGDVYIGAQGLVHEKNQHRALGTMAHELGHYAMKLIYENRCRPYRKADEPHEEFAAILKIYEEKKEVEDLISLVFCYPEHQRHAELIVRVPHMMAFYHKNLEKLTELKSTFPMLFEFYEQKTLVDFAREHPKMEARRMVEGVNELCGLEEILSNSEISFAPDALSLELDWNDTSVITSNCPQLTMRMIYQQLSSNECLKSKFLFMKLEALLNEKIFMLTVETLNVCTKPSLIIDCSDQNHEETSEIAQKFLAYHLTKRIIYVQGGESSIQLPFDYRHFEVTHSWCQVTRETQQKFLHHQITFQGFKMDLGELLALDSVALDFVPLQDLLNEKLQIGNVLTSEEVDGQVERKFLLPKVDTNWFEENFDVFTSRELLTKSLEEKRGILLSDEPGMGKTIEFNSIANKVKKMLPSRWVLFVDLKEFVGAYKKDENFSQTFEFHQEIVDFFCNRILMIKNFEAKVFTHLFQSDRVTFLMDGFDEISPSFNKFVLSLMTLIRDNTENVLWVSTRPHLEQELKNMLNQDIYKLQPFDEKDRKKFFEAKLKRNGVQENDLHSKVDEIENLLTIFERSSMFKSSVTNPLILRMVSEIFDAEDVELTSLNFYTIYERFIKNMIKKYSQKGFDAEEELSDFCVSATDIMAFHQRVACETIFPHENDESHKLVGKCFKDVQLPPVEQMVRVGLITCNNSGRMQFVHRTFAEFFVVNFFKKTFLLLKLNNSRSFTFWFQRKSSLSPGLELFQEVWSSSHYKHDYKMIKNLLDCVFESFLFEKDLKRLEMLKRNLKKVFPKKELSEVFRQSIEEGLMNFIRIIVFHLAENRKCLIELWTQENADFLNRVNALKLAVKNQTESFVSKFLSISDDVLGAEVFKSLLLMKDEHGRNILFDAVANKSSEIFNFLMTTEMLPWRDEERKDFLVESDIDGHNLLMHSLTHKNVQTFVETLKLIKDKHGTDVTVCMLKATDRDGRTIMHFARLKITKEESFKTFCRALLEHISSDEVKALILKKNNFGENAIVQRIWHLNNSTVFPFFMNFVEEIFNNVS